MPQNLEKRASAALQTIVPLWSQLLPWYPAGKLLDEAVHKSSTTEGEDKFVILEQWRKEQVDELNNVNIIGTLLAGVVATGLSWPTQEQAPWLTKAAFYSALMFSLVSVVCATQQRITLSRIGTHRDGFEVLAKILTRKAEGKKARAKKIHHYVWQMPIMLLNIGVYVFLVGLGILIWSIAAVNLSWDDDMRVAFVFTLAALYAVVNYLIGIFCQWEMGHEARKDMPRPHLPRYLCRSRRS